MVAAAIREEEVGAARRAEPRVEDPVAAKPGAAELLLVGGPEIEHPLAGAGRLHPGAPPTRKGPVELGDDGLVHLVAARPDGRSHRGEQEPGPGPRLHERVHRGPRHRVHRSSPPRAPRRDAGRGRAGAGGRAGTRPAGTTATGSPGVSVTMASASPASPPRHAWMTFAPCICLRKAAGLRARPFASSSGRAGSPSGGCGSRKAVTPGKWRVVKRCGTPASSRSGETKCVGGSPSKRGAVMVRPLSHAVR